MKWVQTVHTMTQMPHGDSKTKSKCLWHKGLYLMIKVFKEIRADNHR